MGVTYSPHLVPPTAGKKMQPPGNIGSEAIKTSRKTRLGKTGSVVDNAVKNRKAQDILAKRKADAAKATLPLSYGPPWAHYLGGYQDRLLGGPLGLPGLRYTAPEGVEHKDYTGVVLG
jgi:hypothetical protein